MKGKSGDPEGGQDIGSSMRPLKATLSVLDPVANRPNDSATMKFGVQVALDSREMVAEIAYKTVIGNWPYRRAEKD
jgi:hypothetical protein